MKHKSKIAPACLAGNCEKCPFPDCKLSDIPGWQNQMLKQRSLLIHQSHRFECDYDRIQRGVQPRYQPVKKRDLEKKERERQEIEQMIAYILT